MATKTIDFNAQGQVQVADYTVYTRPAWRSDVEWVAQPNLVVLETTWCLAPSYPCAAIEWRFGLLRDIYEPTDAKQAKIWRHGGYYQVDPLNVLRHLVKIVHGDGRIWVGVLEHETEEQGGAHEEREDGEIRLLDTGLQRWHAYGLEKLLDQEIFTGVFEVGEDETARGRHALTFNDGGLPNRSALTYGDGAYVFAGSETEREERAYWSTREIVKHLLEHHQPRDESEEPVLGAASGLVLSGVGVDVLPDWDRPTVSTEGKSLYQLLVELIDHRQLRAWRVRYTEGASPTAGDDSAEIHVVTATDKELDPEAPGGDPVPANPSLRNLEFETDPLTTAGYQISELTAVDQLVVRGDRRRCVFTMDPDLDADPPKPSIAEAWTSEDEAKYFLGPEELDEWADASVRDRQLLAARHRAGLPHVISHWKLPDNWDGQTRLPSFGDATYVNALPDRVLFPLPDAAVELEPTLPLFTGVDYSGAAIADDSYTVGDNPVEAPPLVLIALRTESLDTFVVANAGGLAAGVEETRVEEDHALTCHVSTAGRTLILKVQGAPQHALDGKNVNASLLASDERVPEYDSRYMLATVSVRGDRIEVRNPPDGSVKVPAGRLIRRRYIDAPGVGETYVAVGTVVGVTPSGTPLRTTKPGFIPPRSVDEDASHDLLAIAKLAAEYYFRPRRVATIRSFRFFDPDDLELGDFVLRCGQDDSPAKREINGLVTQITYRTPLGDPQQTPPPENEIVTSHGELDALRLLPGAPGRADPTWHAAGLAAVSSPSAAGLPGGLLTREDSR
jgi:hypothetical protein